MVQTSCLSKSILLPRHLRRHISGVKTNLSYSYSKQIFYSKFIFWRSFHDSALDWGAVHSSQEELFQTNTTRYHLYPAQGGNTATPNDESCYKNVASLFTAAALTKPTLVHSRWEEPHILRKAPKHVLRNIIQGLHSYRGLTCVLQVKKPTTINRQKQLHNRWSTHTNFKTFWLVIKVKFPNSPRWGWFHIY